MNKKLKHFIISLFILVGWSPVISSCRDVNTFYVAPYGNDSNPGSLDQPWRTIQKAATAMRAGDTVLIHAGTYFEKVVPMHSGAPGKYITYQNFGDGEVIIDGQGGTRTGCIEVKNQAYLRFIGLSLKNAGYEGLNASFAAFPGSNHLILDRIVAENSRFGIMLRGDDSASESPKKTVGFVTIKNSIVRNNAAYGVFLYYKVVDTVIGPNNLIYNENEKNGVPIDDQYGINLDTDYPGNPAHGPRRITIIENEVYGNRIQGIRPWNSQFVLIKDNYTHHNGATGIQIEDGCSNIIVEGNTSEYNAQSYEYETGIWIDSTENALVQNNRIRGNQIGLMVTDTNTALLRNNIISQNDRAPEGSNVMGVVINSGSTNITFVHNTVWNNGLFDSRGNLAYCIKPPVANTVIKNNIFSESAGEYDLWLNCEIESDFNNIYNAENLSINWIDQNARWTEYLNLSDQDQHSITFDPLFSNPSEGDFSLAPDSPIVDRAGPLAWATAAGSGTTIPIDDARYFSDGMGMIPGDQIMIGGRQAIITRVDPGAKTITVDRSISWERGDVITYHYSGAMADIGAVELEQKIKPIDEP